MSNLYRTIKYEGLIKDAESLKAVDRSIQALYVAVLSHLDVMASIRGPGEKDLQKETIFCLNSPQSREKLLREALLEAIEVLEESRKAFKSKRLEMLRRKLTKALIDFDR